MLTISFDGQPKARALVLDGPVGGVSGIVECDVCGGQLVLADSGVEEMSDEIERFIKEHICEPLARLDEVIAFAERLKRGMPGYKMQIVKGQKLIKEL